MSPGADVFHAAPQHIFLPQLGKCILYIKILGFFLCLSELIEELGSHRGVKIGMYVSNDMTTIKFYDLSEFFTSLQKNGKQISTPFLYKKMTTLSQ